MISARPPDFPTSTLVLSYYDVFADTNLSPAWKLTFVGDYRGAIVRNGTNYWLLRACGPTPSTNWVARIDSSGKISWTYGQGTNEFIPAKECSSSYLSQFAVADDVLLL
jgi:hypothetical protein